MSRRYIAVSREPLMPQNIPLANLKTESPSTLSFWRHKITLMMHQSPAVADSLQKLYTAICAELSSRRVFI